MYVVILLNDLLIVCETRMNYFFINKSVRASQKKKDHLFKVNISTSFYHLRRALVEFESLHFLLC
jgi:hypothetical protein